MITATQMAELKAGVLEMADTSKITNKLMSKIVVDMIEKEAERQGRKMETKEDAEKFFAQYSKK